MTSGILVRLGSSGTTYAGCAEFKKVGGRACKPDSVPHPNCEAVRARGDHSSSPGIATGIQQPTRGFSIDDSLPSYCRQAPPRKELSLIEPGRLSPPQTSRAFRRRLTGFPVRCHRASLRRRSILCGTFRDAVVAPGFSPASSTSPPGVTRRVALSRVPLTIPQPPFGVRELTNVPQDGVRTFLPPSHLAMTKPAITRPAATYIIPRQPSERSQ